VNERAITIEHNGKLYTGHIGQIEYTQLGYEDHGIFTASVGFKWDGGGVGIGGYALDQATDPAAGDYSRRGSAYGLDHIIRLMETVGVEKWEELQGARAIVLFDYSASGNTLGSQSRGIAGLMNDKVFIPGEHAEEWRAAQEVTA
jgi:hypothetical protein